MKEKRNTLQQKQLNSKMPRKLRYEDEDDVFIKLPTLSQWLQTYYQQIHIRQEHY